MMFSKKAVMAGIGLGCAATVGAAATGAGPKRAAQVAPNSIDTTPPVVRAFGAGAAIDLGVPTSQLLVDLSITDDMSGLDYFYVYVLSPSMKSDQLGLFGAGTTNLRERVALTLPVFAEPGVWEINGIGGYDRAGNHFYVDGQVLATLGNTRFTVTNKATDTKPPKLISGKVLTPVLSRSQTVPGTSLHNEARAQVTVSDVGNRIVSGPNSVTLTYCLTTSGPCLYLMNYARGVYGEGKRTVQASSSVPSNEATGTYRLSSVRVTDNAGNERAYVGTEFGGDTDFSTMFDSVTIEVTP